MQQKERINTLSMLRLSEMGFVLRIGQLCHPVLREAVAQFSLIFLTPKGNTWEPSQSIDKRDNEVFPSTKPGITSSYNTV